MSTLQGTGRDDIDVYLGFWTNWSQNIFRGATLTVTRSYAGVLIAFLAIFVGIAGNSFWRIACFIFHSRSSSKEPQDALYHQRQAIFRNSTTAQDAAWSLACAMRAWSRPSRTTHPYRRLFPAATSAVIICVSFTIAGLFSSNVTSKTSNEVLIRSNTCGYIDYGRLDVHDTLTHYMPYSTQNQNAFMNYAMQCYQDTFRSARPETCQIYVKPRLPIKRTTNASCPFAEEICQNRNSNLLLDSGFLNSHDDLGINMPLEDRFLFRMVHQCAPIVSDGFSKIYQPSDSSPLPLMRYYYGEINPLPTDSTYDGFTFEVPANISRISGPILGATSIQDYRIG